MASQNTRPPPFTVLRAKMGVFLMKMCIKVFKFLLNLEEHSVYYSNEKRLNGFCAPAFA